MNEEELKKPKLIWEGTLAEAIKLGKITQEDVDRWNREDEEGESFNEGYEEGFQKGKLEQKKEELKIINELIKELSKFEYMEKDGYCLEHKKWEDNTNCITKNDFLANYCETSDVAGAIKILIQLQKEIGGMKE